jgi:hypothetical protein
MPRPIVLLRERVGEGIVSKSRGLYMKSFGCATITDIFAKRRYAALALAAAAIALSVCAESYGGDREARSTKKEGPPKITVAPPVRQYDGCLEWMIQVMARAKWLLENELKYMQYKCVFRKEERLPDKKNNWYTQIADMRFRHNNFGVRLAWTYGANKDYVIGYIRGWNENRMRIKTNILWITVDRLPTHPDAMKWTRHPVTNIGMRTIANRMLEQCGISKKKAHKDTTKFWCMTKVSGRDCYKILRQMPDDPDYYGSKSFMYIDKEWLIPVRVEVWDKNGQLVEKYTYEDIEWGQDFSDDDLKP